jgi:hypothetical protein
MNEPRTYPYPDGNVLVLGPEVFVSDDERVICWQGVNYVRQDKRASDDQDRNAI